MKIETEEQLRNILPLVGAKYTERLKSWFKSPGSTEVLVFTSIEEIMRDKTLSAEEKSLSFLEFTRTGCVWSGIVRGNSGCTSYLPSYQCAHQMFGGSDNSQWSH